MMHWPSCTTGGGCASGSSDPVCNFNDTSTYDERLCRLSSYRALLQIWKDGGTRSVGVSNFNVTHLGELEDAGLPLPAVNQVSFSGYHSDVEMPLLQYMRSKGIIFNSWSPLGRPDSSEGCPPGGLGLLDDPVVTKIATAHGTRPGKVLLAWAWALGVVHNARSQNVQHMMDNLHFTELQLTAAETAALASLKQVPCGPPHCTTVQK